MKYYINTSKELFGIEQGQEFIVKSDWIECILQEDGMPFSKYNTDGTPDLEAIQAEQVTNELSTKITEAKAYLVSTDYKMLPNYVPKPDENLGAIITKRNEAREFIRNNNA